MIQKPVLNTLAPQYPLAIILTSEEIEMLIEMLLMIVLLTGYFFGMIQGYRYLRALFADLNFPWKTSNRVYVGLLCLAGPAALMCALCVDLTRPVA